MKKKLSLVITVVLIVITYLATSYFTINSLRRSFNEGILEMKAFNELHRIRSWDSLEQLLIKGCNKEALEYVQMEQSLHLLSLQESLKNGAKLDESEKAENPSIIRRVNSIVNKGKYYIPSCK